MDGKKINLELLVENLSKQLTLYAELCEVLSLERKALATVNIKEIRDITFNKEILLHDLYLAEKIRNKWHQDVAKHMGLNISELTIEKLLQSSSSEEKIKLENLKNKLIAMVMKAKELNIDNQRLTENALRESQTMKENALGLTGDRSHTYGPKGSIGNNKESQVRFLSREA